MSIKPQTMSGQLRQSQILSFKWNKERVEKVLSALCLIFKSSMGHVYFVAGRGNSAGKSTSLGWFYIFSLHTAGLTQLPQPLPSLLSGCCWRHRPHLAGAEQGQHLWHQNRRRDVAKRGKKAREKPDTPSFPTPPAVVPPHSPTSQSPWCCSSSVLKTSPGWCPRAGVLLEQTVIFTTDNGVWEKPAASVLLPSESIFLCLVKTEDEGGGGGRLCQVCCKMAEQENWEIKGRRSPDL